MKEIFATEAEIRLDSSNQIDSRNIQYIYNPHDLCALEEAIRIKEKHGGEVIIYSVGRVESLSSLKYLLAMGADRGMLIHSTSHDSRTISTLLAMTIHEEDRNFNLILAGWIGIDRNNGQVPGRLSQLLQIPIINMATELNIDSIRVLCQREGEASHELIEARHPAIITVQRGINIPRFPLACRLMDHNEERIKIVSNGKGLNGTNQDITYSYPKPRKRGKLIDGSDPQKAVEELLKELKINKVL